jgi:dimethylargininase
VPTTYDHCIRSDTTATIDVKLAAEQHERYCAALAAAGVDVVRLEADDRYPDCCFVEDPALVIGDRVVILNMGESSRRGESEAIREELSSLRGVTVMGAPGTVEGGDVLRIGNKVYVGVGPRSDRVGFDTLRSLFGAEGFDVIPVELHNTLHLKSVCAYLGGDHVVWCPGHFDENLLADYQRIDVRAADAYSANCIALNGRVFVAEGFPETVARIERAGFDTIEVPVSEFRKGDGGVSCLSVRF